MIYITGDTHGDIDFAKLKKILFQTIRYQKRLSNNSR